jgi:hypothetical protein
MSFDPHNPIIILCVQGMAMEEKGNTEHAGNLFMQAWNDATDDLEKYLAAYFVAKHEVNVSEKLKWFTRSLEHALKLNDSSVQSAYPTLYTHIAKCYEALNNDAQAKKNDALAASFVGNPTDNGPFYHGTKAEMKVGDLLTPGFNSNYKDDLTMNHIYFTALVNGAGLAAALAKGEGAERVYIVQPTGDFEHDPNVTDKKFPGNPTRSYRTTTPLKIVGEVTEWQKITPEQLKQWKEKMANVKGEIIN